MPPKLTCKTVSLGSKIENYIQSTILRWGTILELYCELFDIE